MKVHAGTLPFWIDSADLPSYPRLARNESVDVVIVGGGITGLTAAYLLTLDGRSVAVLERDRCAQIDTGHTSAHLTNGDRRVADRSGVRTSAAITRRRRGTRASRRSRQIDAIVRDLQVDLRFRGVPGYLHAPIGAMRTARSGCFRTRRRSRPSSGSMPNSSPTCRVSAAPASGFGDQARFHPRNFCTFAAIARSITIAVG